MRRTCTFAALTVVFVLSLVVAGATSTAPLGAEGCSQR